MWSALRYRFSIKSCLNTRGYAELSSAYSLAQHNSVQASRSFTSRFLQACSRQYFVHILQCVTSRQLYCIMHVRLHDAILFKRPLPRSMMRIESIPHQRREGAMYYDTPYLYTICTPQTKNPHTFVQGFLIQYTNLFFIWYSIFTFIQCIQLSFKSSPLL